MVMFPTVVPSSDIKRNVPDVLKDLLNIVLYHLMLNKTASNQCHAKNLHGFKRWHRVLAKSFFDFMFDIEAVSIDNFDTLIESSTGTEPDYVMKDIATHLTLWKAKLTADIAKVKELNAEYVSIDKTECHFAKVLICILNKGCREDCKRILEAIEAGGRDEIIIQGISQHLHIIYEKEECKHKKFYMPFVKHAYRA